MMNEERGPQGVFVPVAGLQEGVGGKIGPEFSSSTLTQYSPDLRHSDQKYFSPHGETR